MHSEKPSLPSNRSFGALFVGVFVVLALWVWWRGAPLIWVWLWGAAASVTGAVTLVAPAVLAPLNRAWMTFGHLLNRVISPVVLGVMYAVLIIPVGLVMRLAGRDVLSLKIRRDTATYWKIRSDGVFAPDRFKNQF